MRRNWMLAIASLVIGVAAADAVWSPRADLRAFDPAGMAQLETATWCDYYEKRYGGRAGIAGY